MTKTKMPAKHHEAETMQVAPHLRLVYSKSPQYQIEMNEKNQLRKTGPCRGLLRQLDCLATSIETEMIRLEGL